MSYNSLFRTPSPPETAATLASVRLEMKNSECAELQKFRGMQPGAVTACETSARAR